MCVWLEWWESKGHRCRNGTILGISLILVFSSGGVARAAESTAAQAEVAAMVGYSVSFVDADDANHLIFHSQTGEVPEGTSLNVSFPEQIIGSDGHIWKSAVQSPQLFELYGTGTEKIYIEYERGSRVPGTGIEEDADILAFRKRLERWKQKAWVSAIGDAAWHEFYLIGRDFTPSAKQIGVEYDAVYSEVEEDSFSVDGEEYIITRIRVRRNWDSRTCTHQWTQKEWEENDCLKHGRGVYVCGRCQAEKTERLPALGHLDENGDQICDRCGSADWSETPEKVVWKEGDVQLREVGGQMLSFTCIDDDYHDWQDGHRKAALFLCDRVIRADVDTVPGEKQTVFSFGTDNNYKTSKVRVWLQKNGQNSSFCLEPIHTGIQTAYTGSTEAGAFSQASERGLVRHDIGYQLMNDRLFCLSLEEALAYRAFLWRFDSEEDKPQSQVSAYSQG